MNILAIDACTDACSVALQAGEKIFERYEEQPRKQSELILPMIEAVLTEASSSRSQINYVAFTQGPGSFTGLRITAGVVQGLSFALDTPVVPLSTLQVVAMRAFHERGSTKVVVTQDACMGEVYWGIYALNASNIMQKQAEDRLIKPNLIDIPSENDWYGAGSGFKAHGDALDPLIKRLAEHYFLLPRARDMIPLAQNAIANGNTTNSLNIKPVYLRNKVV